MSLFVARGRRCKPAKIYLLLPPGARYVRKPVPSARQQPAPGSPNTVVVRERPSLNATA